MRQATPRIIAITGATRGLGRVLALGFAELGHTVAGCGRAAALIEELRQNLGPPHEFQAVDVRDDPAVRAWADGVVARLGAPDLLVNNAGIANHNAPLWNVPVDECNEIFDVNIKGMINVIRHFVPPMIARGSGVIVNMSSGIVHYPAPSLGPYTASKWAVEGLTRSLAHALPRGVSAIALSPGTINTDLVRRIFGADAAKQMTPEKWARKAIPFLLKLGPRTNGRSLKIR
jgi:NAD(P)-dependent dehydrogenase (short-subunit alcohol dehydrogenase family)